MLEGTTGPSAARAGGFDRTKSVSSAGRGEGTCTIIAPGGVGFNGPISAGLEERRSLVRRSRDRDGRRGRGGRRDRDRRGNDRGGKACRGHGRRGHDRRRRGRGDSRGRGGRGRKTIERRYR